MYHVPSRSDMWQGRRTAARSTKIFRVLESKGSLSSAGPRPPLHCADHYRISVQKLESPAKNLAACARSTPAPYAPLRATALSPAGSGGRGPAAPQQAQADLYRDHCTGASSSAARATFALLGPPPRSGKGATAPPRSAGPAGASGARPGRGAQTFPRQTGSLRRVLRGKD